MKCNFDDCSNELSNAEHGVCADHGLKYVVFCNAPSCFGDSVRDGLCQEHYAEMFVGPVLQTPLAMDSATRKKHPVARGVLDYFPDAVMAVANVSYVGNEQHNPGQPMHWAKEKSTDHADCIARHLIRRGTLDTDGLRHSAKVAWRALALLQMEIEGERAK